MNSQQPRIIISGGGTGGHIFPAIAIADTLKKRFPQADILFIGAKNRMEMDRVPKAGYPIEGLWISGFKRELSIDNLSFPFKLLSSMINARRIIKRFKPDVVVGVGGFASGPTMKTASSLGIPIVIQEQNSFPGVTNKLVAKKAAKICVAYENMERWFPEDKIVLTGNPLRNNIKRLDDKKEEALRFFGLDTDKKTILLVGGSQGALGINKGISAMIDAFKDNDYQMIWQTGNHYLEKAQEEVKANGLQDRVKCTVFIDRMDLAYAAADVVISRAGAMSISELSLLNKAVVFVPLPTAAEDHQTKNAMSLVKENAAMMVKNSETEKELIPTVFALLEDEDRQKEMKDNIAKFAKPNAAEDIADQIEIILNKK
ncbi:MAG: undecaprenyldiphospho-muramoylpentapeptide beta-N-acetylglucosaminyltransferase [Bacteroidales bacterium]|nr:undecaprenyldiphospho-muramoylpentapeptide beta-N-acetylglucosaminyltransferase [Bacteroidales bacterium]